MEMYHSLTSRRQLYRDEQFIIWEAASADDKYYGVFNVSEAAAELPAVLKELLDGESYTDLWANQELAKAEAMTVNSHGGRLFKVVK